MASALLLGGCGAAGAENIEETSSLAQEIESAALTEDENKEEVAEVSEEVSETEETAEAENSEATETGNGETYGPDGKEATDFISKHGYINARETEADELNNTHWVSFENYNIETYEYSDSETSEVFENITLKMGENGEGVIYFGDDTPVNFTYTLSEYPASAEGKTETGEDFFMYFQTFNFDGADMEIIDLEIGSWVYYLWPVG